MFVKKDKAVKPDFRSRQPNYSLVHESDLFNTCVNVLLENSCKSLTNMCHQPLVRV